MHSDSLLNHISCFRRNTFFWNTPTFHGVTGNTHVDYILCPRAVLPHITSCKVWRNAGDTLQIVYTNQRRDHRPVVLTIQARLACEGAPCEQRHFWDQDKIFAAATQGIGRDTFITEVEDELQRRLAENASLLDVDVVYTAQYERPQRNTEDETMSTKPLRHTVLNVVGTSAQAWQVRCARASS